MNYESRKISAELRAEGARAYIAAVKSGFEVYRVIYSSSDLAEHAGRQRQALEGCPVFYSGLPDQMRLSEAYMGLRRA